MAAVAHDRIENAAAASAAFENQAHHCAPYFTGGGDLFDDMRDGRPSTISR